MANQEHLNQLEQGAEHWNQWKREHWEVQADLSYLDLREVDLSHTNLTGVNLTGASLNYADLRGTDLSHINLTRADLTGASLNYADLREADLSHINLTRANLTRANLTRVNLNGAFLSEADLSGAVLRGAVLSEADLRGAVLHKAFLREADLSEASLSEASLRGAFLNKANLTWANLTKADLSEVSLEGTVFAGNDLRTVKGLVKIDHRGPSRVELHTVWLPQDGSALHFLRGVGIPDEWMDFYRALVMSPIQYHSVFISYASKDDALARRLHADLQDQGVRCWFAPEDMKIGDKIRFQIDEMIHLQDKLLLLLSEHALESSWVEIEVEAALEKEKNQQREVLFPVRLDESVMRASQAWAKQLRRARHIGDFTHWNDPQAYRQAFDRLLRDLKVENDTKGVADGKSGASFTAETGSNTVE